MSLSKPALNWFTSSTAILCLMLTGYCAGAQQVPLRLTYQGKLTDDSGKPVTGPVNIVFTIYEGLAEVFSEPHNGVSLANDGSFTEVIGNTSDLSGLIGASNLFLGVRVNNVDMGGRAPINSAVFALQAQAADYLNGPANAQQTTASGNSSSGAPVLLAQTDSLDTIGERAVLVMLNPIDTEGSQAEVSGAGLRITFKRESLSGGGETTILETDMRTRNGVLLTLPPNVFLKVDFPPAGTFRYKAYVSRSEGSTSVSLQGAQLLAIEL